MNEQDDQNELDRAFEDLESLCRKVSDFDYEKELAEWREEKFGDKTFD